jgi:hypothetical protein
MVFGERAVVEPHADRPEGTHLLEAQGRVAWVGLEQLEILVGQLLDRLGQLPVVEPELGSVKCFKAAGSFRP